jgi:hypothetical protein
MVQSGSTVSTPSALTPDGFNVAYGDIGTSGALTNRHLRRAPSVRVCAYLPVPS